MAERRCVPKRNCYFNEEEFVASNPGLVRLDGEDAVREEWRASVAAGQRRIEGSDDDARALPPACPDCDLHHWPKDWRHCDKCESGRLPPHRDACPNCGAALKTAAEGSADG